MSSKHLPQIILFYLQITLSSNYLKFLTFSNYFPEMGVWLKFVNVSEQLKLLLLASLGNCRPAYRCINFHEDPSVSSKLFYFLRVH